jgi:FtsZ-binding cell division protein ZapB
MPDEFKKVSARIPLPIIEKLEDMGISNQTEAIIKGLERLISEDRDKTGELIDKTREDNNKTAVLQARIDELQIHNETLKNELKDLKEDSDKTREDNNKTAVLQAKVDELQAHKETLKKELEDLKSMHNNYMLQMQTLINQKAIEAPGAKKPWYKFW